METLITLAFYVYASIWSSHNRAAYYAMEDKLFFALPKSHQVIPLTNPDTLFLDAAIFHATNQIRREYGLQPFRHDFALYLASSRHATSMVSHSYFNHTNPFSPYERTAVRRVELYTKRFKRIGENIGRYQTLMSDEWMVARRNAKSGQWEFLNESNLELCTPYTYEGYARFAVSQWMASPPHRATLMNPMYTYLGCAARLSPEPYRQRKAPYASLVQNFGGEE